jgi:hypothetical protein
LLVVSLAIVLIVLIACGNGQKKKSDTKMSPTTPSISQEDLSRCKAAGKRVVKLDLNRDKQPDVWKLYAPREEGGTKVEVLTCKEIDLNFDGRKDIWIYYEDDGTRKMEEMDLDFDGRVDMVTFRRAGKVIRQELDTNYDSKPDIWKYYEEEVLGRIDRDSDHDGRVDFWEYYEGGQLDRVGYDKDGDGKVDAWDRAPVQASATPEEKAPAAEDSTEPPEKKEEKSK